MDEILVIAEHRQGILRDITHEMLFKADQLRKSTSCAVTVLLIGGLDETTLKELSRRADKVLLLEQESLKNFNPDSYKETIFRLIQERQPFMTLIGHTSWGMGYAPALSVKTGYPFATDCIDILVENRRPLVIRQMYGGKVFSKVSFKESKGYILTVRPGAFPPPESVEDRHGEILPLPIPADLPRPRSTFLELVDTGAGELDITQADLLVSIGRGVGDEENIATVKGLADLMGGTLACSRPIVDKNWLPKFRQVGTSGKSVRPKVYLALGISGAFQHIAGISGAGTVIAVNKDRKAPIFRVADFGVVEDLFKVLEAMKEKLAK
ncbi:MAG: electron transfer flavoprotein subunit alpha/FixB family protein [Desulfatiglandaceae bacterium]|jgi:electron transfer flavoprotein alpha subunit